VACYVDRASGFGLPGVTVDGTDFFAVYEAAGEIIRRARGGGGLALLECEMVRFYGHFEGDAQTYRGEGNVEKLRADRDCIKNFTERVIEAGIVKREEFAAIDRGLYGRGDRGRCLRHASDRRTDVHGLHGLVLPLLR
jgi:pyruvate dehydrogenase E1 component alpha subunit